MSSEQPGAEGLLNKGCEWKGLFMSLADHLPREEQGWRGEETQARGSPAQGQLGLGPGPPGGTALQHEVRALCTTQGALWGPPHHRVKYS